MKPLNSASIVIFFLFYPLYSCSSMTTGKSIKLPQELFLMVIEYIVPNLVSPRHPEEIEYQDKQLNPYRSVCKEWQGFLDRRLTFKDFEQIFIVKYHWPWKTFAPFCENHFQFLKLSSFDQSFIVQQEQQISLYDDMMSYINTIKDKNGHDHKEWVLLQTGIQNGFYSYLYNLLPNKEYNVWQKLFDYAIKDISDKNMQKKVIDICKEQYLHYSTCNSRYDYLESFINMHCDNELNDAFFKNYNNNFQFFDFNFLHLIECVFSQYNEGELHMLDGYINAGGFISSLLYSCILPKLYFGFLNQEPNKKKFFEKLSKIVSDWNFSVLFGLKFAFWLTAKTILPTSDFECKIMVLDYKIFFSSFVNMYDYYNKTSRYLDMHQFQIQVKSFFKNNQEWLLKGDKNNKTFLYYLLLLVSKNKRYYFILKSFINTYSTVLDQTYIVEEQEKLLCQNLLKLVLKNNSIYSGLTKSDRIILRKIVGVPEKTRLLKMKSLLSKNLEYITYCLRRLTSPLLQIAVFFGLIFLLMKIWDRVGRRFFVTKAFSRT